MRLPSANGGTGDVGLSSTSYEANAVSNSRRSRSRIRVARP